MRRLQRLLYQLPFPFLNWLNDLPCYTLSAEEEECRALYLASSHAEMAAIGKLHVIIASSERSIDEVKCMAECSQDLLLSLPSSCGHVNERKQAISTAIGAGNATSRALLLCHQVSQVASSLRRALQHALRSIRDVIVLRTQMACESKKLSCFIRILQDAYGGPLQESQLWQLLKARSKVVVPLFSGIYFPATEFQAPNRPGGVKQKSSCVSLAHQQSCPSAMTARACPIQWLGGSEDDASGSIMFAAPGLRLHNPSSGRNANAFMPLNAPPGLEGMPCLTPHPR